MLLQQVQTLRTTIVQADAEQLGEDDLTYQQLLGFAVGFLESLLSGLGFLANPREVGFPRGSRCFTVFSRRRRITPGSQIKEQSADRA